MSFWKSKEHKAKREYNCEYCAKTIQPGEKYSRQTGVADGGFHDYCLCLRCLWLLEKHLPMEFMGSMLETLRTYDYITCPACDSANHEIKEVKPSKDELVAACQECKEEWEEDISIDGLKRIAARR